MKTIPCELYHYNVELWAFDFQNKKHRKCLKKHLNRISSGFDVKNKLRKCDGWCLSVGNKSIILIDTYNKKDNHLRILNVVRHETQHAAKNTLDYVGSETSGDDEHFVYLCDYFFKESVKAIFENAKIKI